jgi:hypothetical protein
VKFTALNDLPFGWLREPMQPPPASMAGDGRCEWHKPDGTVVYFICFAEQLAIIPAGGTLHVVGNAPAGLRRLKRICTLVALAA